MNKILDMTQAFKNSQAGQAAQLGLKYVNKFGKMNILFIATCWFIYGEQLIANNERNSYYGHTWIQRCDKPTRTVFEKRPL